MTGIAAIIPEGTHGTVECSLKGVQGPMKCEGIVFPNVFKLPVPCNLILAITGNRHSEIGQCVDFFLQAQGAKVQKVHLHFEIQRLEEER